jgi:hypothetical protein
VQVWINLMLRLLAEINQEVSLANVFIHCLIYIGPKDKNMKRGFGAKISIPSSIDGVFNKLGPAATYHV